MRYGIFTKTIHVEKLVNYLNEYTDTDYIISTRKDDVRSLDFDIGISYCFPFIVDINYPTDSKRTWYNYHPAPLPKYPGIYNYADAIHDKVIKYGVTLHKMTMDIDKGDIIKRLDFDLRSIPSSVNELGCITHYYLFQLFKQTIRDLGKK